MDNKKDLQKLKTKNRFVDLNKKVQRKMQPSALFGGTVCDELVCFIDPPSDHAILKTIHKNIR